MEKTIKKEGYLSQFIKDFVVSRASVYRWVQEYRKELEDSGIITEKRRGARKYIYVNDLDEFLKFFKERGIYFVEE